MVALARNRCGNWEARVSLGSDPVTGARRRATRTFPGTLPEADARRRADDFEREAKSARRGTGQVTTGQGGAMTVEEWLNDYVAAKEAFSASPASIGPYMTYVRTYVAPRIGKVRLYDLREHQVERMLADLLAKGGRDGAPLSKRTVRSVHSFLQGAFRKAVDYGYMQSNPVTAGMRPKAERLEAACLDGHAMAALLVATVGRWDVGAVAARLALGTGLRRSELCGLAWGDIDGESHTLHVVKVVVMKRGGGVVRKDPKSKAGVRAIRLDEATWQWLMQWRGIQAELMAKKGRRQGPGTAVVSASGSFSSPQVVSRAFAKVRDAAGGKGYGIHALRHTHASHLLRGGVDVKVIQGRLGHSSAAITLDTYSHVLPGADVAAADATADVIAEAARGREL